MAVQTDYSVSMTAGIEGQLADDGPHDAIPGYNDESSADIPFGHAVKWGATASDNEGVLLPAAEGDAIIGITIHSHDYRAEALGTEGVKITEPLSILRRGRILVVCASGCSRGDRLWVRAVATGSEQLGSLENADDSTDTVDCTKQGEWMTTAAAGALAVLEVDFLNEPD